MKTFSAYAILIPFIQFGFGWWLNVSTLACAFILFSLLRNPRIFFVGLKPSLVSCCALMFLSYIWQDFGNAHSFLRLNRECLILILFILFVHSTDNKKDMNGEILLNRTILVISVLQLTLVVIQLLFINQGNWLGPDPGWFAGRGGVIPDALDLRYSYIRPSGTFSEPSYLGLVSLTFMVISGYSNDRIRNNSKIFFLNLIIVILSQSKLALLFAAIYLVLYFYRNLTIKEKQYRGILFPFFNIGFILSYGFLNQTVTSSKGSLSIELRLFKPFQIIFDFVLSNPLGTAFYSRIDGIADIESGISWEAISHNSIFNLVFSYGLVGFFIIFLILRIANGDVIIKIFLIAALLQNGSFLDFDKLFLVYFTIYIYRGKLSLSSSIKELEQ